MTLTPSNLSSFISPHLPFRQFTCHALSPSIHPYAPKYFTHRKCRIPTAIIDDKRNPPTRTLSQPTRSSSPADRIPLPKSNIFPPGKFPLALELDFVLNHPITEGIIAFLVSLNCLAFALQTLNVGPTLNQAFHSYESNLSILFLIEYFARWYGKGLSPRYLLTRAMILDFIAVAPLGFAVADQSEALFVRILRLSRILRIQSLVMDSESGKEMMESMTIAQIRLANIGLSLFSLLYVSAGLFYQVEKDVNPAVQNFFDAFYFSTVTLFTVGYGDVTPLTSLGKAITVLTVLTGAVLIPLQLSEVERVRRITRQEKEPIGTITENMNPKRFSDALFPPYDVGLDVRDIGYSPPLSY